MHAWPTKGQEIAYWQFKVIHTKMFALGMRARLVWALLVTELLRTTVSVCVSANKTKYMV